MEETNQNQAPMQPEPHKEKNTGMAIVAYILFFVPLLTDAKNDPFVKYHVKQGLVLFIAWAVVAVVAQIGFLYMFTWVLHLGLLVLLVMGIMNAMNGKEEPLPVIGQFAQQFKF